MGCFCTRTFLEFARVRGLSSGILFCDLSAAYYAVVRELLMGGDLSGARLQRPRPRLVWSPRTYSSFTRTFRMIPFLVAMLALAC